MTQLDVKPRTAAASPVPPAELTPVAHTVWGLDPLQLYSRFWASHGVQVVRQGERSEIVRHAELYLLTDPSSLVLFPLSKALAVMNWIKPKILFVRLHDARERGYREWVLTDDQNKFVRFQRVYDAPDQLARVVLTPNRDIAQIWQGSRDPRSAWKRIRKVTRKWDRATRDVEAGVYSRFKDDEVADCVTDMVGRWSRPDSTIGRAGKLAGSAWRDPDAKIDPSSKFVGPVWIGCGRTVAPDSTVIGPSVMWDDPGSAPPVEAMDWLDIEPTTPPLQPLPRDTSLVYRFCKRTFDICFALAGLCGTIGFYPFIMLAIWIEDGRPFFFGHLRETQGGKEFPCWKFRSMRKDAEKMKAELAKLNQADGPQFFMDNDPRLTRVGKLLRKLNMDEFPQFWNVLVGDMSVVGPRPSPFKENQFCPAWREARLSIRPGITGLWQVKRTRRAGTDFQEWIKYDIEYVETRTFWLDMKIIWKTFSEIFSKISRS